MRRFASIFAVLLAVVLAGCGTNPYPKSGPGMKIYYNSYSDPPKHMDPAVSYYSYEAAIIDNIYESLYQYDYLKRPYVLIPCLADTMPEKIEQRGKATLYRIRIKKGVLYQEDPCFTVSDLYGVRPREVIAEDFVNAFKRIADPSIPCPIRPTLLGVVKGLDEFYDANKEKERTDYDIEIDGVRATDTWTLEIELKTLYPQIIYWLAMHFTSPMPREAIEMYNGREGRPTLDVHPVGTGPFVLHTWDRRLRIILDRNPLYREEFYPSDGEPGDRENGLLEDAGKRLPLLDRIYFAYEVEAIPRWRKFLQGWYDGTGLSRETFDQVITKEGTLSGEMADKRMNLYRTVEPTLYYFAFNMNDSVVGGMDSSSRKLRQALACAFDAQAFIRIFLNGRGVRAHEIVPPGIFGHRGDFHPYAGADLDRAKKLLAEAGYPDGIDPSTGKPLVIRYDNAGNIASARPQLQFIKDQFEQIGVKIDLRTTDLNTFRTKVREGNYQMMMTGWGADYPDPENFLFLLESGQRTVPYGGGNVANYANEEFDRLYQRMAKMENSPEREELVAKMTEIIRRDCPWIPIVFYESYALTHSWVRNFKLGPIINNAYKYRDVVPQKRDEYRKEEGSPVWWPLVLFMIGGLVVTIVGFRSLSGRDI